MSSADQVIHKYIEEVTLGTTPAAALTKMNVVSSSIDSQISTTVSNQINSTRSDSDLIRTEGSTSGELSIEWQHAAIEPFVGGALGGNFSIAVAYTAATISADNADNSLNDSASGFSTANILPGHWIKATGFTGGNIANNGKPMKVVSVTTSKIVVSGVTLVADTAGESVTIKGKSVRNGSIRRSFTIEREFADLTTTFVASRGMVVNTLNLNSSVGSIVNGSLGFNGTTTTWGTATVGTGAAIVAVQNELFNPTDGVGTIYVDGVALANTCVRTINLTTTNNTRNQSCLGNLYPTSINLGTIGITGTLEVYFNNTTLLEKFLNGTAISLSYSFDDVAGNVMVIDLPNCKFNTGSLSGIAKQSDVMVSLGFTGLHSSSSGYAMQVSSLAA